MQGKLIVIDGTDGSGKTTQTDFLIERLKKEGHAVETVSFPQYNQKSAGLVEEYLEGKYGKADEVDAKIASIFYAVDRFDASFKMREWLAQGKIVIANRYVSSNLGHQGGKILNSKRREKTLQWLYDLEYKLFKLPKPDISVVLFVPPEISQKMANDRGREDWHNKKRDVHEEDIAHLKAAAQAYLFICKTFTGFYLINCVEDNQIMSREQIHELVWEQLKNSGIIQS